MVLLAYRPTEATDAASIVDSGPVPPTRPSVFIPAFARLRGRHFRVRAMEACGDLF
jgi:hypothetical protein